MTYTLRVKAPSQWRSAQRPKRWFLFDSGGREVARGDFYPSGMHTCNRGRIPTKPVWHVVDAECRSTWDRDDPEGTPFNYEVAVAEGAVEVVVEESPAMETPEDDDLLEEDTKPDSLAAKKKAAPRKRRAKKASE